MSSLSDLLQIHAELDVLFLRHQYALLRSEFDLAFTLLESYERSLLAHMTDEEEYLLPLYIERADIQRGGAVDLFVSDHEKMREWLKVFANTAESLKTGEDREKLLLELLDRESFYKRLCSHHDIRESRFLYPALDAITTEDERSQLFKRFTSKPAPADERKVVHSSQHTSSSGVPEL
jgi:hemerythrin-like domain-containing protein